MRRFFGRTLTLLLAVLLAACSLACADDRYDSRNASISATASADRLRLYEDDTLLSYTVTVPKQCVKLTIQLLAGGTDAAGEPNVLLEQSFKTDSEGVSVAVSGDSAVWTVPCDFGLTGMDGLRVVAQIPMGKKADYLFADLNVAIDYPAYTADTLHEAYRNAIVRGAGEPYYFTMDPADEALVLAGPGALSAEDAILAGYGFLYPADAVFVPAAGEFPGMFVPENRLLCAIEIPNDDFAACYAGEGVRVADSARAILSAQADAAPDAARYPVAALLYEKARGFLGDIPLDSLSARNRLQAIYERVYNEGLMALPPDNFAALPEAERAYYEETAYGLFSGFGGDSRGYADAFYLLCGLADIPCVKQPCALIGGEKEYCVNAVQLDGKWLAVDVFAAVNGPADDMYAHFLMSDEQADALYEGR